MHGEQRRLAAALVLSLLAHAALLGVLRMPHDSEVQEQPLSIILTGSLRQVPSPASSPSPAPQAVPTPSVPPPAPIAAPREAAEPPQAAASLAAAERSEPPTTAVPAAAVAPKRVDDQVFLTKDQWTTPPQPQTTLDPGQLAGTRVVGRRLLVTMWIDDEGVVRRAEAVRYELRPEIATLLEQMVTGVRFAPASLEGRPVRAEVTTRLCFDDAGELDTSSEGCWRFDPPSPR